MMMVGREKDYVEFAYMNSKKDPKEDDAWGLNWCWGNMLAFTIVMVLIAAL